MIDVTKVRDLEFDGVDHSDAPDYSDVFATVAYWDDGRELTEEELDELNDKHSDFVYEKFIKTTY